MFSERAAVELSSDPLTEAVQRHRALGTTICDLTRTGPTELGLPYDTAALQRALSLPEPQRYRPDCLGERSAREALVQLWRTRGVSVSHEQIALTASTSEAYALLFKLFCDPGSQVLVPEPSYPLLAELARYEGVQLVPYRLAYDGAWYVDLESVARAVNPKTRAVIVVSPNNPTGSWLSSAELQALLQLGLPVISDEVFWAYPWQDPPGAAAAGVRSAPSALLASSAGLAGAGGRSVAEPALIVALDGLSKYAALPGLKLAWMTFAGAPERVRAALSRLEYLLDAYLSVNSPVQRALPALLAASTETRQKLLQRVRGNLAQLDALTKSTAVSRCAGQGGWNAVLRLPNTHSDADWALSLLNEQAVLVQPGWLYDFEQPAHCVVSLITPEADFEYGVRRLVAHVQAYA